ncbi:GNAT family N-acetyltransferase [Gammaproteobacteria bacterium]|nr:GNAT family N-acetyltransferase [Gammaproteobacteria bacterium]
MITIYNTFDGEIKDLWFELEENSQISPFQSYNWLSTWYETAGINYSLFIACIFLDGRIEAILPFGIQSKKVIKKLEWLGGAHADYMSPILRSECDHLLKDFDNLWIEVLASLPKFDLLSLKKQIPKIGNSNNPFIDAYPAKRTMQSYQSNFNNNEELFLDTLSKKLLSDNARQKRRLSEQGKLKFNILNTHEDCQEFLNCMFNFKRKRYKQMRVHDFFEAKENQDFYINLPRTISSTANVSCSTLTLDDEIIALHWGVTDRKKFFYLMPAYNISTWGNFSPGKLLLHELLEWCNENQFESFDFTGGEEQYKKIYSNDSFWLYETNHSFTIRGKIYLFSIDFGRKVKHIIYSIIRKL